MQNPKTGTTWTPDVRPENIETFEETYTPEGGEQQTITYKAVDNHPILNKVLDKFAFFKSHVSAIWYNKLANITLKQKLDEMDAGLEEVSAKLQDVRAPGYIKIGRLVVITALITTTNNIVPNGIIFPNGTFPKSRTAYAPISCANITSGTVLNPLVTNKGSIISNVTIEINKQLMISGSYISLD